MGNRVSAAGPGGMPAPPMPGVPVPPPPAPAADPSSQAGPATQMPEPPAETGPGGFEDLHKKCKGYICFERLETL